MIRIADLPLGEYDLLASNRFATDTDTPALSANCFWVSPKSFRLMRTNSETFNAVHPFRQSVVRHQHPNDTFRRNFYQKNLNLV